MPWELLGKSSWIVKEQLNRLPTHNLLARLKSCVCVCVRLCVCYIIGPNGLLETTIYLLFYGSVMFFHWTSNKVPSVTAVRNNYRSCMCHAIAWPPPFPWWLQPASLSESVSWRRLTPVVTSSSGESPHCYGVVFLMLTLNGYNTTTYTMIQMTLTQRLNCVPFPILRGQNLTIIIQSVTPDPFLPHYCRVFICKCNMTSSSSIIGRVHLNLEHFSLVLWCKHCRRLVGIFHQVTEPSLGCILFNCRSVLFSINLTQFSLVLTIM